jgi:hypothetical protein
MEVFIKEVLVWNLYGLSMTSSKEEYLAKVTPNMFCLRLLRYGFSISQD